MKVVAFNGSPRKDGNTAILLNYVLHELSAEGIETELVQLAGERIIGCRGCYTCWERKDGRCAIDTDILNDCIEKMLDADGILMGSPVYYGDITAEMKALLDRSFFVARANNYLFRRKVAAAVVAVRRAGASNTLDTMYRYFTPAMMVIPGSTYWNLGMGEAIGEVEKDEEGILTMKNLGRNMAWLIKALHAYNTSGN
ncbi:MAG: flavodoxin family protein [Methanomicrobiales archaeon]|nr:flavodoxin family protein [Methanomicrobiales archaeon]